MKGCSIENFILCIRAPPAVRDLVPYIVDHLQLRNDEVAPEQCDFGKRFESKHGTRRHVSGVVSRRIGR